MKLEDIDRANTLQRHRARYVLTMEAATSGWLGDFDIWHRDGERIGVWGMIPADPIRQAIIEACREALVKIDADLQSIGVSVKNPFAPAVGDAASWKSTAEMYARAWQRELGGHMIPKAHLIDALVVSTERLRRKAEAERPLAAE